jgi:S-adenosylmethionine:tRNA ribosyltransferase-isomerase
MSAEHNPAEICFSDTLCAYDYHLPPELIAAKPRERGCSRLLALNRATGAYSEHNFADLPRLLPPGALLVVNSAQVVPARVHGARGSGGKMEFLLLTPLPLLEISEKSATAERSAVVEGLLKPARYARLGVSYAFADGNLELVVLEKGEFGRCVAHCRWNGDLAAIFDRYGEPPLPPYMRRRAEPRDKAAYQTIYSRADKSGAVAAPTAGLHFTPQMRDQLSAAGFGWAETTLYVGYGTFSPVRVKNINEHVMHSEYAEIGADAVLAINGAKQAGRPVVAIGTTVARLLEGVTTLHEGKLCPHAGWINIFMRPGYRFSVVDGLITNFHLPRSTLLMLVSAFAGREMLLDSYAFAVRRRYAFFSYGDAMLIS